MTEELNTPEQEVSGHDYHVRAEQQREGGSFLDAAISAQQASDAYLVEGNITKAAEALSSQFLAYRHQFEKTGDEEFKKKAQDSVERSVKIISDSGEVKGLGIPLYNLAKFHQTNGDMPEAIDAMKKALKAFEDAPDDPMGFPAQIAEIKTRLSALEFGNGDDTAGQRFGTAFRELSENPHPNDYAQSVWLSGSFMHMAEAFVKRNEKEKAKEYLFKADEIIGDDERFKLRREQIEKLRNQI